MKLKILDILLPEYRKRLSKKVSFCIVLANTF